MHFFWHGRNSKQLLISAGLRCDEPPNIKWFVATEDDQHTDDFYSCEDWCEENGLQFTMFVRKSRSSSGPWLPNTFPRPYIWGVEFEDAADAALFKLRWMDSRSE